MTSNGESKNDADSGAISTSTGDAKSKGNHIGKPKDDEDNPAEEGVPVDESCDNQMETVTDIDGYHDLASELALEEAAVRNSKNQAGFHPVKYKRFGWIALHRKQIAEAYRVPNPAHKKGSSEHRFHEFVVNDMELFLNWSDLTSADRKLKYFQRKAEATM